MLAAVSRWKTGKSIVGVAFAALLISLAANAALAQDQEPASIVGSSPLYSLSDATGWINSKPLTAKQLKGMVVLVDFWEYSCINCIRAVPYISAWAEYWSARQLLYQRR